MKKMAGLLAVMVFGSVILSGCGAKGNPSSSASGSSSKQSEQATKRIGMVTDVSGVNDNSFNEGAWNGLQRLQTKNEDKVKVKYLESKSNADYETNMNQFVQQGWDLKFGIGFPLEDTVKKVAQANPKSLFAIIDSNLGGKIPDNVTAITFREEQGSFLVGVIAGLMTKTNKVGFIGGVDFAVINRFENGFKAGVKTVNPKAEITSVYTNSFSAPDLGKQTAATMYDKGADIIFHASGGTGDGLFNEANERKNNGQNVWAIGVDKDQSQTFGTKAVLTSMIKRVDNAIFQVCEQFIKGQFNGGKEVEFGLKDDGVGIAPTSDVNVPKDILNKAMEYRQQIIDGKITVPRTKEEFEKFKP
ncbi:BMP family protein [Paenibacillus elgii]